MIKRIPTRSLSYLWFIAIFTVMLVSVTHAQTIETAIPADSILYLKLQNLQECREAIGSSENWKEAAGIISAASQWQDIQQLMQALPMFTGTDIQGLIETFLGSQVAVTVSPGTAGLMVGIVIENSRERGNPAPTESRTNLIPSRCNPQRYGRKPRPTSGGELSRHHVPYCTT